MYRLLFMEIRNPELWLQALDIKILPQLSLEKAIWYIKKPPKGYTVDDGYTFFAMVIEEDGGQKDNFPLLPLPPDQGQGRKEDSDHYPEIMGNVN